MPDDESRGLTLREAAHRWFMERNEEIALARWFHLSPRSRQNFLDWNARGRGSLPGHQRLYEDDGRLCAYEHDVLPTYEAAKTAADACAKRFTDSLHRGAYLFSFQTRVAGELRTVWTPEQCQCLTVSASLDSYSSPDSVDRAVVTLKAARRISKWPKWDKSSFRVCPLSDRQDDATADEARPDTPADAKEIHEPLSNNERLARDLALCVLHKCYVSANAAATAHFTKVVSKGTRESKISLLGKMIKKEEARFKNAGEGWKKLEPRPLQENPN